MIDFEGIGDLLDVFGATLDLPPKGEKVECGGKPPKAKPVRFTEWNNLSSFIHNGYLARVTHIKCGGCNSITPVLQGIFSEEIHRPTGSRRLTKLDQRAQWPTNANHRQEVESVEVGVCGWCVGDVGFGKEVGVGKEFTLEILP